MGQSFPLPPILHDATDDLNDPDVGAQWRSYISEQMAALAKYDAQRPIGHVYEFHIHARRVASLMQDFAQFLGWSDKNASTLYWATLPHDIGKMALPVMIWDREDKPSAEEKSMRRTHVEKGLELIKQDFSADDLRSPFAALMMTIMENHHEALDGTGLFGKTDADIDPISRMSCICDGFDGWSVWRPHFGGRDISVSGVITRMKDEKAGQFDADLLEAFAAMMREKTEFDKNYVEQYDSLKAEV